MKKEPGEGGKLRDYLKENKIKQEPFALSLGMTRQGLIYHLGQQTLDPKFKMLLRDKGVKLFDEKGQFSYTVMNEAHPSASEDKFNTSLSSKLIKLLEERVALESEKSRRLEEENQKLKEENRQLVMKLGKRQAG